MLVVALALTAALTAAWELWLRGRGFGPSLDDNPDLWADARRRVDDAVAAGERPMVLIGDSRMLFDADLDELERGLGKRPIQLSTVGTNPLVLLEDLADDEDFDGVVISHVHPGLYFAPPGAAEVFVRRNLERYHKGTVAQRVGAVLWRPLDARLALLNQEELNLRNLIDRLRVPQREGVDDDFLPYLYVIDGERRARLWHRVETDHALRDGIRAVWMHFPSPPPFSPFRVMAQDVGRLRTLARARRAADKLRSHGGTLIYVAFPASGELGAAEAKNFPREHFWDALLAATGAPGVHWRDHAELGGFECPEWSHLSASDSVTFTQRLVPHLARLMPR